jgi:hypothetical protein
VDTGVILVEGDGFLVFLVSSLISINACWGESWRAGKAQVLQASSTLPFCFLVTPLFLLGAEIDGHVG